MKKILTYLLIFSLFAWCSQKNEDIETGDIDTSLWGNESIEDLWKSDDVAAPQEFPVSEWYAESPYNLPQ